MCNGTILHYMGCNRSGGCRRIINFRKCENAKRIGRRCLLRIQNIQGDCPDHESAYGRGF